MRSIKKIFTVHTNHSPLFIITALFLSSGQRILEECLKYIKNNLGFNYMLSADSVASGGVVSN